MADQENITKFNLYAAELFASLYTAFPEGKDLTPEDFDVPKDADGYMSHADASPVVAAVRWFVQEGYIRCAAEDMDGKFYGVVLSEKGFSVLRTVPDALKAPLGDQVREAVKGGAKSIGAKLIDQVINLGIKYVAAHGGLPT